jgi:hypothetical protein
VLSFWREKREQVIALGQLGWSLRRIEQATGVRRETAGDYLRGAGIALRRPGGWGRHSPSKAAIDPITDSEAGDSKPAIEVITGFLASKPGCGPASSCEPYRELIALELARGRNAMGIWQLCRDRHSCQNAEFSTMPSRGHLTQTLVLQTPGVTGILSGPLN